MSRFFSRVSPKRIQPFSCSNIRLSPSIAGKCNGSRQAKLAEKNWILLGETLEKKAVFNQWVNGSLGNSSTIYHKEPSEKQNYDNFCLSYKACLFSEQRKTLNLC